MAHRGPLGDHLFPYRFDLATTNPLFGDPAEANDTFRCVHQGAETQREQEPGNDAGGDRFTEGLPKSDPPCDAEHPVRR